MIEHPLSREVIRLGGAEDAAGAESAACAVLAALRPGLPDGVAAALAGALPEPEARILRAGAYGGPVELGVVRARVTAETGLHAGHAVEVVQIVCRALGEILSADVAAQLRPHLPDELRPELDERPAPGGRIAPERKGHIGEPEYGHTLATGRPGSRHPLSEAAPSAGHSQSVAHSDDPHADTKLSGAHGLTQERLHESLATGKPGPEHTLSGDRDKG